MSVKISELPSLETLADNDILAGVDTSEDTTSKITLEKIKNYATEDVYDKEEVDETVQELQSQIDSLSTIYNAFPTASDEGESMTLDDTAEVTFKKLDLKGNTSQVQYTGKNLLHQNQYITTRTTNGITYTNNGDGTFSITGTATANTSFNILYEASQIELESGKTYYLYSSQPYNNQTFNMSIPFKQDGTQKYLTANHSITTSGTISEIRLAFYTDSGNTINAQNVKLMLVEGSTPGEYEPYVGGTASPNPSYPQPVNVVSGDNTIDICGKNLLNIEDTTYTNNGLTYKMENGVIRITGTAGSAGNSTYNFSSKVNFDEINKIPNGTQITFSVLDITGLSASQIFIAKNGSPYWLQPNATTKKATVTKDADLTSITIWFSTTTGTTYDITIRPQLEVGSTATTYEPYIRSSYPIYLGVENLLPSENGTTQTINGVTFTKNSDGTITANGTATAGVTYMINDYIWTTLPTGTYILSDGVDGENNNTYFTYLDVQNADSLYLSTIATNTRTYSTSFSFRTRIVIRSGVTLNNVVFKPQLEKGSKVNSFNKYGVQPIELCKIGTYQDYIYKEDGSWYLHKEVGKVVLDGSESGWVDQGGQAPYSIPLDVFRNNNYTTLVCDKYIASFWNAPWTTYNYLVSCNSVTSTQALIKFRNIDISSLADFKTWLSTNKPTVYYVLATPTNTLIEDTTLIEQLEELKLATSYEGQTNINQENNDKPFILDVEAIKKLS